MSPALRVLPDGRVIVLAPAETVVLCEADVTLAAARHLNCISLSAGFEAELQDRAAFALSFDRDVTPGDHQRLIERMNAVQKNERGARFGICNHRVEFGGRDAGTDPDSCRGLDQGDTVSCDRCAEEFSTCDAIEQDGVTIAEIDQRTIRRILNPFGECIE